MARISYSLYLYHGLVKWQLPDLGRLHHGKTALTAILCMLVATASYYGIERPFMKMRDRGHRASVLLDNGRASH
jgi:peptidoglycan/LPS O-acetylase OafA/YrhL